jgi:nucleotide-binding universal stress UspA family protein
MQGQSVRRVVVGVDGTPRTVAALRWAATEALRRDAEVYAVHAWGDAVRPASYAPVVADSGPDECARRAAARLADSVLAAFGGAPPVPIHQVVDARAPVPALLDHGREADLLVVATRVGGGTSGGSGPGSTAMSCLRHAPCPVVVLPTACDRVEAAPPGAERAGAR